jgi:hypothetical protein
MTNLNHELSSPLKKSAPGLFFDPESLAHRTIVTSSIRCAAHDASPSQGMCRVPTLSACGNDGPF